MKELLVWLIAVSGAYFTFSSFEPLYDRAKQAAARAGFANLFEMEASVPKISRFNTRVAAGPAVPLRGTIPASQEQAQAQSRKEVVLSANDYGHFHALAQIKGQQVEFMTDTGATYVALSYETAQKLGLAQNLRFNGRSTTANGVARVASIMLEAIRIGDITVNNVPAVIAEPGRMSQNLLGMSFIKQLSGFELMGSRLTLIE
jgi:aspartyl protease family protein